MSGVGFDGVFEVVVSGIVIVWDVSYVLNCEVFIVEVFVFVE